MPLVSVLVYGHSLQMQIISRAEQFNFDVLEIFRYFIEKFFLKMTLTVKLKVR